MTRDEAEAVVARELPKYQQAFGLPHWDLSVRCDLADDPEGDPVWERKGLAHVSADYNAALIQLNPGAFRDADHLLETLRHELYHVVLSPYEALRDVAENLAATGRERQALARLWRHATEKAVINLGRMFAGLAEANVRPARKGQPMPKGKGPGGKRITVKGYSRAAVGTNIANLVKAGVPQKQAVAEALSIADQAAKAAGKPEKSPKRRSPSRKK